MTYWNKMISLGLETPNPEVEIPAAIFTGSGISALTVLYDDSPDVMVWDLEQTEISVFVDPNDNSYLMNSNNSGNCGAFYGANFFYSDDSGQNWGGQVEGAGGGNSGDPTTAISLDGRMYVGFIHSNYSQGVSYSTDGGNAWTSVQCGGNVSGGMLDKNHMWIDNSASSSYDGNVYNVWTNLDGGANYNNIEFVSSANGGVSWSSVQNISSGVNSGSHDQGCNVQTGPNGEVYVVWAIYDSWPSDECALGFNKSLDGGATFEGESRILSNIKGIRNSEVSKNMRVNSFPSMAVDMSTGDIYVVWTNIGTPGVNTGTNRSVYMIKSTDEGDSWSSPVRVNQGPNDNGKESYFPWITCDPVTGILSVIFYDDRNVSSTQAEAWVSNSNDGGTTWEDFKVSDVAFTPSPLPGMATGYMGDYLGISANNGMVYPAWCDNRTGSLRTYVSPFETNSRARPENLQIVLNEATGQTDLTWEYTAKTMQHFVVYRGGNEIGTTGNLFYTDYLPDYGEYEYSVTAMHEDGESGSTNASIIWGAAIIEVSPESLSEILEVDQTSIQELSITNNGQLDLIYNISTEITSKYGDKSYCAGSGGGDEYISGVEMGDISNTGTGANGYGDYTTMSTDVSSGDTYQITITNGQTYSTDDLGIWVDWNQDEDFEDAGEEMVCESNNGGEGTFDITVPENAIPGPARMRIRIKYNGSDCGDPCGTTTFGEVEDYTLNVSNWLSVSSTSSTVTPGNTDIIDVTFSSFDLEIGTYNATITIESNDTDTPNFEVPVTLEVTGEAVLGVVPTAVPQEVCSGEETQLNANPTGGTQSYTYSWTSNPAGFTSTDENPTANPTETTTYTVEVDDGDATVSGEITVTVTESVTQADIPTGPTEVENEDPDTDYIATGADNATSYEWQITPVEAGTITGGGTTGIVNWDVDFVGTAYISVRGINDCGEGDYSETLEVVVSDVLSVTNVNNKITWDIYPNPTNGKFILALNSELLDLINIEIYDITGKKVYSKTNLSVWASNSMEIDLVNSPAGLYMIHITGKGINETKKLIIQ